MIVTCRLDERSVAGFTAYIVSGLFLYIASIILV